MAIHPTAIIGKKAGLGKDVEIGPYTIVEDEVKIGQRVKIKGWYRRGPIPYIQVDTIESESGSRHRNYSKHTRYLWAVLAFVLGIVCLYFWF